MIEYEQGHADGAAAHRSHETRIAVSIRSDATARCFGCPDDATGEYRRGWIDGFNECADKLRTKFHAELAAAEGAE